MAKKIIRLSESELRRVVGGAVRRVLREAEEEGGKINGYDADVWEKATEIVNSMDWSTVEAVKYTGDPEKGYSVLVRCTNADYQAWVDVWIDGNGQINTDWNQFIYGARGTDLDYLVHHYPFEDGGAWSFEYFTSTAEYYLIDEGVIVEDGEDHYRYADSRLGESRRRQGANRARRH